MLLSRSRYTHNEMCRNEVDESAADVCQSQCRSGSAGERGRKELVLFPVRVDEAVMETPEPWARKLRDQRNVGDFRRWKNHEAYRQSFARAARPDD